MKKILVVDDDPDILEALKMILEMDGYHAETINKGEETYVKVNDFQPDVILLDVMLSGLDGRHICKKLKTRKDTHSIPIIMISAHPTASKSIKQVGADDFIAKPFDIDDLLTRVRNFADR